MKSQLTVSSKSPCGALTLALSLLVPVSAFAQQLSPPPAVPVGWLSTSATSVRTGTNPVLKWNITHPLVVDNFVTVGSTGTVTAKSDLVADIRVLGAGVTTQGHNGTPIYIRTAGLVRLSGSTAWNTIFDGKNTDSIVQRQGIIGTYTLRANQSLDFGGKYFYNNSWNTFYTSLSSDNVRTLTNGQTPPAVLPAYNAPSLESFIRPYLDASGKVRIGPMDVIVFMELTHTATQKSNPGYDLQDLVLLVTFRTP